MNKFKRNAFIIAGAVASLVLGLAPIVKSSSFLSEVVAGQKQGSYTAILDESNIKLEGMGNKYTENTNLHSNPGKPNDINLGYVNGLDQKGYIGQFKKNSGYLYNINAITNITSITVDFVNTSGDNYCYLTVGDTEKPTTQEVKIQPKKEYTFDGIDDYFFKIKAYSNAMKIISIKIVYSCTKYISETAPTPTPNPGSSESSSSEIVSNKLTLNLDASNNAAPNQYASKEINMPASNGENITLSFKDAGKYDNKLQLKRTSGLIYNKDALVGLSKIELKANLNSLSIYYGPTMNPTTNETVVGINDGLVSIDVSLGNKYFKIRATDAYARIESLVFTFDSIAKFDPNQGGGEIIPPNPVDPDPTPGGGGQQPQPTPGDYVVPTEPLTGVYQSLDIHATGATLLSQARDIMVSNHTYYSSYDNCRGFGAQNGKAHITDMYPGDPTKVMDFYSHDPIDNKWGTIWNREHVWPKSLSNNNWTSTTYGGSDLHHIRPNITEINGTRSSMLYGDTNGTLYSFNGHDAAYIENDIWEPLDFAKGDVARIILYCFVHYNTPQSLQANDNLSGNITSTAVSKGPGNSLPITNVMKGSTQTAFDTLLNWHKLDPVDDFEIYRNNEVFKIQGNRNPFIDQPWLVNAIWG